MDHPRRRRITLTQWLLIVIVAALVANAALQTISIMQHKESARRLSVLRSPKYNAQAHQALQKVIREARDAIAEARREVNEEVRDVSEPDRENALGEQRSGPTTSNTRRIERMPYRAVE
jgi:Sec-independent protein translocase protein TatA